MNTDITIGDHVHVPIHGLMRRQIERFEESLGPNFFSQKFVVCGLIQIPMDERRCVEDDIPQFLTVRIVVKKGNERFIIPVSRVRPVCIF